MTIESEVAALTAATTALLGSVNTAKATLDSSVSSAAASATTAGQHKDAAATHKDNAAAQVTLAAGYAASAASVAQQDLGGAIAAALHRSPNAVKAFCFYNTANDANGGAWRRQMLDRSWMMEALQGKWLGAQATEAAARAAGGVANDYFQLITDGKFYKLVSTAGTAEVYRGNTAEFPAQSMWIGDSLGRIVCYDLTAPGRPMWMVFVGAPAHNGGPWLQADYDNTITGIFMLDAVLMVSIGWPNTWATFLTADFAVERYTNNYTLGYKSHAIADRNSTLTVNLGTISAAKAAGAHLGPSPGVACAAVHACSVPQGPVDMSTGLRRPLIALATSIGPVVIRPDGVTVQPSGITSAQSGVHVTPDMAVWTQTAPYAVAFAHRPALLQSAWVATTWSASSAGFSAGPDWVRGGATTLVGGRRGRYAVVDSSLKRRLSLAVLNTFAPRESMTAHITSQANTGWSLGGVRRCYMADADTPGAVTQSVAFSESFDAQGTWSLGAGWSIAGGDAVAASASSFLSRQNTLQINKWYTVVTTCTITSGTLTLPYDGVEANTVAVTASGTYTTTFFATTTTLYLYSAGLSGAVQSCTVYEGVMPSHAPRIDGKLSHFQGAVVGGTLTKAAVAAGAQMLMWSGWSAINTAREAYTAELDFGTSAFTVPFWGYVPAGSTTAGVAFFRGYSSGAYWTAGINASGQLYATVSDGATTRTVTTAEAWNTGAVFKGRMVYCQDGSLYILVNGERAAVTRGNPLGSVTNPSAVFEIGNNYGRSAPWPGGLCLLKPSIGVPTVEQARMAWREEARLMRPAAVCTLASTAQVLDLSYDDATDRWLTVTSSERTEFAGLVRVNTQAPSAGTFAKAAGGGGVVAHARITTNPGVDVTIPSKNLQAETVARLEAAARSSMEIVVLDYVGGFTATTTTGNTAMTSVTNFDWPVSLDLLEGVQVTGTGVPANATAVISGSTAYLSAAATASGTVAIAFKELLLPPGMRAVDISVDGLLKTENPPGGASKDWSRSFMGECERILFMTAPGATARIQARVTRMRGV